MDARALCTHQRTTWPQPTVFALAPALEATRPWRYAECVQLCLECGQRLLALRVDLRGAHRAGPIYRVVFDNRVIEGNSYRLEWYEGGVPTLVLQQSAGNGNPTFDVDPPVDCSTIKAGYEDDFPFALVRRSERG